MIFMNSINITTGYISVTLKMTIVKTHHLKPLIYQPLCLLPTGLMKTKLQDNLFLMG